MNIIINHYQCTDWFTSSTGADGDWHYRDTTCQYVDSFIVADGSGILSNNGPVIYRGGGGLGSVLKNADNILDGCAKAGANKEDKSAATAKQAESRYIVSNAAYEYGGFVLSDASGNLFFSQGQLIPLNDNVAVLGAPSDHNFPPGYTIVGFYHTHPATSPTTVDSKTGSQFSQADENYANANNLTAYVMDVWSDTSTGTSVDKVAFYQWAAGSAPKDAKDGNKSC